MGLNTLLSLWVKEKQWHFILKQNIITVLFCLFTRDIGHTHHGFSTGYILIYLKCQLQFNELIKASLTSLFAALANLNAPHLSWKLSKSNRAILCQPPFTAAAICSQLHTHCLHAATRSAHLKPLHLGNIVVQRNTDRDDSGLIKLEPVEGRVCRIHSEELHLVIGCLQRKWFS